MRRGPDLWRRIALGLFALWAGWGVWVFSGLLGVPLGALSATQIALGAAVVVVLLLSVYATLIPAAGRVVARAVVVALPVALLGVAGFVVLEGRVPQDDAWRVIQAVIAGGVIALGWIVAFAVQEFRRESDRRYRQREIMESLRQEIYTAVERLDRFAIAEEAKEMQRAILAGGNFGEPGGAPPYTPFATSMSPTTIYESVSDGVTLLSGNVLPTVVRFYASYSDLSQMIRDLRSDTFAHLARERRARAHESLAQTRQATLYWALRALVDLNREVGTGAPGDIPISDRNRDIWTTVPEIAQVKRERVADEGNGRVA